LRRTLGAASAFLLLAGLANIAGAQSPPPPQLTLDWPALAAEVVDRLDLQPGERFLAIAMPGSEEAFVAPLRYAVAEAGAVDLGVIDVLAEPWPEHWEAESVQRSNDAARGDLRGWMDTVDAAVALPFATPLHPAYAAYQDRLRDGEGRMIHFHWLSGGSAIALPGQPLPPTAEIEALYQRAILDLDYEALAEHQRRFESAMRDAEILVTSPAGTDLRFRIGDRPVNRQDGDASLERMREAAILIDREIELPAGAVRVAPLEESVNGTIAFPPSQWAGRPAKGVVLTFADGRVVEVEAASGREHVELEMERAGDAGRAFREFALGFNPLLAVPDERPWIPYFGYGAGVVRLSLGDNSELGGAVGGGYVRWNFFVDTTVTVDGEIWVRDGRMMEGGDER
jgi:hypothetical protein